MEIRPCTIADFQSVCNLLSQLWPEEEVNTAERRRCFEHGLQSPNQTFLCAVLEERAIGFCSVSVRNSLWQQGLIGHIDELVVDRSHRRMGVGSMLLRHLEDIAAGMGCRRLELDSAHHRTEAHAFYESLGFHDRAKLFSKPIAAVDQTDEVD